MSSFTNFEKSKLITRALVGKRLSPSEWAFCIYLLDQQYGYKEDKGKDGDSSGYGRIANALHTSTASVKRAVKSLVSRRIIFREINATHFGNRYKFNENTDDWASVNHDTSIRNDTSTSSRTDTRVVSALTPNNRVSTLNNLSVNNNASSQVSRSESIIIIMQKYFETYRQALGKEHPALKEAQKISIRSKIQEFADEFDLGESTIMIAFEGMIESHFTRTDLDTDFNINHFATYGIMKNLFNRFR